MPDRIAAAGGTFGDDRIDFSSLRFVLDQARDCIKILSPEGRIEYINSEAQCALGIHDVNSACGKLWPDAWPDESRGAIKSALEQAERHSGSEIKAWRPGADGDKRWWHISISPLSEKDGELAGILTISRDITGAVASNEAQMTLMQEMRHRLRNAYTVASAVVMQSASNDEDKKTFAEAVCGRLADVALSQSLLLEAGEKSWKVAELISTLMEAHGEGSTSVRFTGSADAVVDGHEAMLVALVVGELTNNSLKHGALRNRKSVSFSWVNQQGSLILIWRESFATGSISTLQPRSPGSGYDIMQRMARTQRATLDNVVHEGELIVTLKLGGVRH